jgi:hypothetical protein
MRSHLIYCAVIATLAYPAFVQTASTVSRMADSFAEARIGISKADAAEYLQVADAMEGHPATKLPVKGGK